MHRQTARAWDRGLTRGGSADGATRLKLRAVKLELLGRRARGGPRLDVTRGPIVLPQPETKGYKVGMAALAAFMGVCLSLGVVESVSDGIALSMVCLL